MKVWQKAHLLMVNIHAKLIPILPKDEKWGLCDQIRRSSKSIGANIAEGYGRHYYMDNVRFCYQARGSLDETVNHFRVVNDLNLCPDDLYHDLRSQAAEVRKLLNGYISWLKTQKTGEKEPGANLYLHELPVEYEARNEREETSNEL